MTSTFLFTRVFCAGDSLDDTLKLKDGIATGSDEDTAASSTNYTEEKMEESATAIQSLARGFLIRKNARELSKVVMNEKATQIQSNVRGMMGRDRTRDIVRELLSIRIQSVARGVIQRNGLRSELRGYYSILIQSVVRGFLVRNKMRKELQEQSSILIQRNARGMLVRKKLAEEKAEAESQKKAKAGRLRRAWRKITKKFGNENEDEFRPPRGRVQRCVLAWSRGVGARGVRESSAAGSIASAHLQAA